MFTTKLLALTLLVIFIIAPLVSCQQGDPTTDPSFEEDVINAFENYDSDKDRIVTSEEMIEIFTQEVPESEGLDDGLEMVKSLFDMYDEDKDGLTLEEFKKMAYDQNQGGAGEEQGEEEYIEEQEEGEEEIDQQL